MYEFRLPSLGADMVEGALIEWKIKPGDSVKRGDIVAVIDTVKAAIDIEIFADGIVDTLLVKPDPEKKLPVGTVLALVRTSSEAPPSPEGLQPAAPTGARVQASPAARKRAKELGIDIAALQGSGAAGEILISDVEKAGSPGKAPAAPAASSSERKVSMRRAIAAAMARSWKEIPHYFLRTEIDMTAVLDRLAGENEKRDIKDRILTAALLIKATALALKEFPDFNGFYQNDTFSPGNGVHVGMAVALREGGLIAPAIHDCDRKSAAVIMKDLTDLVDRARTNGLRGSEMTDATITVTSLGDLGALTVFGIIYPPQVALVGFGSLEERPVVRDGTVVIRQMMDLTLSADHRQTDGRQGALFLGTIKEILEEVDDIFGE